jgi:hypothetical protein
MCLWRERDFRRALLNVVDLPEVRARYILPLQLSLLEQFAHDDVALNFRGTLVYGENFAVAE